MRVEFVFTDIDNSLYTSHRASVIMEIQAEDPKTAHLLAERLQRLLGADHYYMDIPLE